MRGWEVLHNSSASWHRVPNFSEAITDCKSHIGVVIQLPPPQCVALLLSESSSYFKWREQALQPLPLANIKDWRFFSFQETVDLTSPGLYTYLGVPQRMGISYHMNGSIRLSLFTLSRYTLCRSVMKQQSKLGIHVHGPGSCMP